MCLAIPARVINLDGDQALVDVGGIQKSISIALVDDVAVGEYLLVHVGYALNKIDPVEAEKTLAMFVEAGMVDSGA